MPLYGCHKILLFTGSDPVSPWKGLLLCANTPAATDVFATLAKVTIGDRSRVTMGMKMCLVEQSMHMLGGMFFEAVVAGWAAMRGGLHLRNLQQTERLLRSCDPQDTSNLFPPCYCRKICTS